MDEIGDRDGFGAGEVEERVDTESPGNELCCRLRIWLGLKLCTIGPGICPRLKALARSPTECHGDSRTNN